MNVEPKRQYDGSLVIIPAPQGHFVMECVVVSPPSSLGRSVYLHMDAETTTDALLALRASAIEARR